jgi:hypothetical protein
MVQASEVPKAPDTADPRSGANKHIERINLIAHPPEEVKAG